MLARMPAAEVTDWQAYEQVTGRLGQERADLLAAMTAYYVVSALAGKKGRKPKLKDMLPTWDRPKMDWRAMREYMRALTVAAGGKINRR